MTRTIELSQYLLKAEESREGIQPLTELEPNLTPRDAYQVQLETIKQKVNDGQRIVGKKIGLTSLAMQQLLGVGEPDYGHLLDSMVIQNGGDIPFQRVMQPKVEAEVAFVLKDELKGPNVTVEDVLQATDFVLPALEIVDSRITDWKIKLSDTIADNASSGLYVLGNTPVSVDQVDLAAVHMEFYKDNELINTGTGAAALGHPANCVAWLANKLSEFDISLNPGEVILSGALSAAVDAEPGQYFKAKIDVLGEVSVRFVP
ncbi:2-keto-4-pentenoate hydratase [Bacillus sp. FJAT-45350]|uniref:2-keto-4-pentenoate hydratase n=1 Tax=Bacillus sp. FJAT-45350 TaxID=2011014 RepID=UPI000BB83C73|nr:2-keto-4-pentenoate hydratase [Bacillus sp. FJAT-45350]